MTSPLPLWAGDHEPVSEVKLSLGRCHVEWPQMLPTSLWWEPIGTCLQQSRCWPSLRAVGQGGAREPGDARGEQAWQMHPCIPGRCMATVCIPDISHEVLRHHFVLWYCFGKGCREKKSKQTNKKKKKTP